MQVGCSKRGSNLLNSSTRHIHCNRHAIHREFGTASASKCRELPVNCSTNAVGPVETVKLTGYLHPQDIPAIPNTVVVLAAICVRPLRTNRSTRLTDGGCNQCNERILNRARAEIEALRLGLQHQEGVFVRATNNGFQIPRPCPFAEKLRSNLSDRTSHSSAHHTEGFLDKRVL
jgi:hypothetical protein